MNSITSNSPPLPPSYEIVLRADTSWLRLELKSLWHYRDLISLLVWRDLVAKYKQTILGPLWFVIQPLMMTVVFTVVFGHVARLSTDGLPPLLFYLCGQLAWTFFALNFGSTANILAGNAGLFSKVYFPRLVVPIAAVLSNLVTFLTQAVSFVLFFVYYKFILHTGSFGLTWSVVFLPLLLLHTAVVSMGVGLLLSALTAKYRDLAHAASMFLQVWMYATPVIYPLTSVPPGWRWVMALNPMSVTVEGFRLALLGTGTVVPSHLACSVGTGIALLIAGLLLFGKVERTFVDVV